MKFKPSLSEVINIQNTGRYNVVPVGCEILSDFCTPIEALKILKNVSTHTYMLESVAEKDRWGRYTFLGFDPKLDISCEDGQMRVGSMKFATSNPADTLRQILADYKSPRFDYLPSFTGGLVGYFSYDYIIYMEPTAKRDVENSEDFKDIDLMLFDKVIAFDNFKQKIVLIVNMNLDMTREEVSREEALRRFEGQEYKQELIKDLPESERFLYNVWSQIAAAFNNEYGPKLVFETLNEPSPVGTDFEWNYKKGELVCEEASSVLNELDDLFLVTEGKELSCFFF